MIIIIWLLCVIKLVWLEKLRNCLSSGFVYVEYICTRSLCIPAKDPLHNLTKHDHVTVMHKHDYATASEPLDSPAISHAIY